MGAVRRRAVLLCSSTDGAHRTPPGKHLRFHASHHRTTLHYFSFSYNPSLNESTPVFLAIKYDTLTFRGIFHAWERFYKCRFIAYLQFWIFVSYYDHRWCDSWCFTLPLFLKLEAKTGQRIFEDMSQADIRYRQRRWKKYKYTTLYFGVILLYFPILLRPVFHFMYCMFHNHPALSYSSFLTCVQTNIAAFRMPHYEEQR